MSTRNRSLIIAEDHIHDDSECYVIAEIGQNHQGNLGTAKELFRSARDCGVNAVKLQKRDNPKLFTKDLYNTPYINENSYGPTYGAHRDALEFRRDEYIELQHHASEFGLTMFATPFDFASVDFLAELDMPAFKTASGDLTNTPLLKYIARVGKPIIMSTGGGSLEDVRRAYDAIMPINQQLCLLQCTSGYPVDPEDMNLRVISTYRKVFSEAVIGLSDHQNGIAMAVVAYVLGARVIEKHFTLNRAWKGTDHAFSLTPIGMKKLVRDLRRARSAFGDGVKRPLPCEEQPLFKMGKKLVAAHDLPAGHVLTSEDIAIKSPNDGLPPYEIENVIGKMTLRSLKEDENISFEDLTDGTR